MDKDITILAIESSCDETAASVVVNGRDVLSNVISSQIDIHTLYGGVVPEIASRKHTERINQVVKKGLSEAGKTLQDMDAIAVTYGPGLVGPLLIGVSEAKALSFATGIPLIGVHHIEGHISANYIADKDLEPPFACLVVSGGHTHLVLVKDYGEYEIPASTRSWDGLRTTRQVRLLTRWQEKSDWDIPADPRLTRSPKREIPRRSISREAKLPDPVTTSASAA